MKTVRNKTHKALKVPLPQGKVLHLGPLKTGQISVHAVEHPPLQRLVAAGEIEIHDEEQRPNNLIPGSDPAHPSPQGHGHSPEIPSHHRGER